METAQGPRGCLGMEEGGGRGGTRGKGVGRGGLEEGGGLGFVPPPLLGLGRPTSGPPGGSPRPRVSKNCEIPPRWLPN